MTIIQSNLVSPTVAAAEKIVGLMNMSDLKTKGHKSS